MPIYTQQPNMAFATLQADFTDDGAVSPTFTPSHIRLTETKTALFADKGLVLVADDRAKIPDNTNWAVYKYEGKADQSGNNTKDSLTTLSRAEAKNKNFSTSHTFTAGIADVIVADSADQLNTILATIAQIHYNSTNDIIDVLKGLNLQGNPITNLLSILNSAQSSPPSTPSAGDFYMDDGTNTGDGFAGLRQYTNGAWEDVGAGGGGSNVFSFFMG